MRQVLNRTGSLSFRPENTSQVEVDYLNRCDAEPVEDPAQAWNALTVGAHTDLVEVGDVGTSHEGWTPLASPGELSPFSRTGVSFAAGWPTKPEIVLEGGNVAVSPTGGTLEQVDSLEILTTHSVPADRLLTTTWATSAATAQAGFIASSISAQYPAFWPETIRGMMVHSAEWTPQMQVQFDVGGTSRQQKAALLRQYGYGVPTLEHATRSSTNALTLIVQETIHPFHKGSLRELHLHDLPWPRDELSDLGSTLLRMRVTLSYFIEPSPTRRGWRRRYR
jgi:hypothetical protein